MRRLVYLLLLVLFVSVSATCVNASTDCERWFAAYRQELAHTRSVQRIAAAKRRAKLYAQRKLAGYVAPKPKVVLAKNPMNRRQTLHHFELACGVLPEDETDSPVIAEETPKPFPFEAHPLNDGVDLLPSTVGDLIAENDVPLAPVDGYSSSYPSGGGAPVFTPPFTGGLTPSTPPVPPPAVPEPASYVLMLTGLAGAAGEVRRRFKSA